jgi:hypothetical protein
VNRLWLFLGALLLAMPSISRGEAFERGHSLGSSLGLPAGTNFEYSYEFGSRAIYVSGSYWGSSASGVQGGFTLERSGSRRTSFAVNLIGGEFHFDDLNNENVAWTYAGLEPYFRYRAFFIAPAIEFGSGKLDWDDHSVGPLLTGRLGFIWRL